jgi:hypothetical protein
MRALDDRIYQRVCLYIFLRARLVRWIETSVMGLIRPLRMLSAVESADDEPRATSARAE